MRIIDIHALPTTMDNASKIHESVFRSFHILEKAKEYLALGVPPGVILDLIAEMEWPCQTKQ